MPAKPLESRLTALRRAIAADNPQACEKLLASGIDINMRFEQARTALHLAARAGAAQVLDILISKANAADVDVLGNDPLMLAAAYGHEEAVERLLPHSNPRRTNTVGWSALTYALAGGHRGCVERLLPLSDLEWIDVSGDNPEHVATDSGYPELSELVRIERWWRRTRQLRSG